MRLKDVADKHGLNLDFLEQVARLLRLSEYIVSRRGPGGGYLIDQSALAPANPYNLVKLQTAIKDSKSLKHASVGEESRKLVEEADAKLRAVLEDFEVKI